MNILWLPNFLPFPVDNGGKVVIANRMKRVSENHNIYMIAEADEPEENVKKEILDTCVEYVCVKPAGRNIVHKLKHMLCNSYNVGRYDNKEVTKAIEKVLIEKKIDLINIDLPMPFVNLYPILDKVGDIPIIINQQNIEFDNVKSKLKVKELNLLIKLYALYESKKLYLWEKKLYSCKSIKAISFVSDVDLKLFEDSFVNKDRELFCSPIGTNRPEIAEVNKNGDKIIVFPAAFDYAPNVHGAVWFVSNVMPILRNKISNVKLYLVGRNPKEEVKKLASEDVIVTGTVESIVPYMSMADVFVVPIFFGGGVKTKLIEMGCYGKPVVSSKAGSVGTLFQKDVDLYIEDLPDEFAKACISALLCDEETLNMADNMKKKTEKNYLWDAIGLDYCKFLERNID